MKNKLKDSIIIGMALFAMFFGAGNLIFPPQIGMAAGKGFGLATIGFFITGIGLPLLGILAAVKGGEALKNFQSKVGKAIIIPFSVMVALTLGLVAIPRTGATTHEMGALMFFDDASPLVTSFVFFAITIAMAIKPTGIVDRIGKFLTPVLVMLLGIIIVKGLVDPIGQPAISYEGNQFALGFLGGYQTMDALGALIFGGIVLNTFKEKGYRNEKDQFKMAIISGGVAALGLALVYGGLLYLGATLNGQVANDVARTSLTMIIASMLLGQTGTWLLGLAVSFACLTTSIGLVATISDYFDDLTGGKIPYKVSVVLLSLVSAGISVLGVEGIVSVAGPILVTLYPIAILLILFILVDPYIASPKTYKITIAATLSISSLQGIDEAGLFHPAVSRALSHLPLSEEGFPWLVPAGLAFLIAWTLRMAYKRVTSRRNHKYA